ncbi:MAG: redox-regulated ATPase YchF [Caldilineaceae bacterium]|nr:redox-regulated ATPase YchF [Caldilineaceae bacterium]MCB9137385.1 redox-regulated ATPase YchF [Caldilineaceae bacterium]
MEIGIIGLPNSGKTTIFNALTGSDTATEAFSSGQVEVHTAVVAVPDPRVDALSALFNPKKTTYAQVTFNDIAGFGKGAAKAGLAGPLLNAIAANEALMLVVRAFEDENVPHPDDSVDPARDITVMEGELLLSDMAVIDRRLERLASMKNRGTPEERKVMAAEEELLQRLMAALEDETPLRDIELSEAERKSLGGFGLMSLKPLLIIINQGDDDDERAVAPLLDARTIALRGRLEAELAQMDPDEATEFLADFGIDEPGLHRAIRRSYAMLNQQSFFTVGEDEVRAWTVSRGATAPEAAGVIHSDLQKGFIRAEVISYGDLMDAGGMAEARKLGKLRLEGKGYVTDDGDIMSIRFNV